MLIKKKVSPIILLSGHIDKLLKVGDKNIKLTKNNNMFLSKDLKFSCKHLKKT